MDLVTKVTQFFDKTVHNIKILSEIRTLKKLVQKYPNDYEAAETLVNRILDEIQNNPVKYIGNAHYIKPATEIMKTLLRKGAYPPNEPLIEKFTQTYAMTLQDTDTVKDVLCVYGDRARYETERNEFLPKHKRRDVKLEPLIKLNNKYGLSLVSSTEELNNANPNSERTN